MENKHKIIAQLKQYSIDVKNADNEQLDVLISAIKGFIYENECLLQKYNKEVGYFISLQEKKGFIKNSQELYDYLEKYTDYRLTYFDNRQAKAVNLLFDNIDHFYNYTSKKYRDYNFYLQKKYNLFSFIEDVICNYLENKMLPAGLSFLEKMNNQKDIIESFNKIQPMLKEAYSFYIMQKEDFIINLYKARDTYIFQYKLAILNVLDALIIYLKNIPSQNILDMNNNHNNLTSEETIIFNSITEDSTMQSIGNSRKDKSKNCGTTYKHLKNIALKLNGTEKEPLKSIKKYKRELKLY